MLGVVKIVALSISSHELNKIESGVFLYCRFSLFLKNPFSRLIELNLCLQNTMGVKAAIAMIRSISIFYGILEYSISSKLSLPMTQCMHFNH